MISIFHAQLRMNLTLMLLRSLLQTDANMLQKVQICLLPAEATDYLMANGVIFMPGKAANAGGVATSALEMCQNSARLSWTAEEVDTKLHQIMVDIFHKVDDAFKRYDMEGNYVAGANIAGFEKVVDAMIAQGIV